MELSDYRARIDQIDRQLVELFAQRMNTAAGIAAYKKEHGLPVLDPVREREKLLDVAAQAPEDMRDYTASLYTMLFELSRCYQGRLLGSTSPLTTEIQTAIDQTPNLFPSNVSVACQGVAGAYSQLACDKLFKLPHIMYFASFEAVFAAIERGLCRYGVLPLENSTAGSVNAIYDLMMKHDFRIVRSVRLKVDHNLLVKPGTKRSDITEIYSHEQAIGQCSKFLNSLNGVRVIPCDNTAMAAKFVAESGDKTKAAIASAETAALYGLEILVPNINTDGDNTTRFIVLSREKPTAGNRFSLLFTVDNKPGKLAEVIQVIGASGFNMESIKSRPMPHVPFEYYFYVELVGDPTADETAALLRELDRTCRTVRLLGVYTK